MNFARHFFGEIFGITDTVVEEFRNALSGEDDTVTLTVAKPYCMPARPIIEKALKRYGVKIFDIKEHVEKISLVDFARRMEIELKTFENLKFGPAAPMFLPMAVVAKVRVRRKAAAWAEYLMLRTGRLYVPGKYFEPKNHEWAKKHNGIMPPAWQEGKPWIENSCDKGLAQWEPVKQAAREAERQQRNNPTIKDKLFGRRR